MVIPQLGGPIYNGSLHDDAFIDAAINRLNDLYVTKKEEVIANSTYQCSTHPILLGLLTAVKIMTFFDIR